MVHEAPLMVGYGEVFTNMIENDITDMALEKFADSWKDRYRTITGY